MNDASRTSKERLSEERLRNTRAWAAARPDMSGSEVIVGAIDELLQMREDWKTICEAAAAMPADEPSVDLSWLADRILGTYDKAGVMSVLRQHLPSLSQPPTDRYGRREPPHGYAYRYHDYRGDVLRFNNGAEVNGGKPFEVVPYWIGAPVTKTVPPTITFPPDMTMAESHGDPRIDGLPDETNGEQS